TFTGGSSILFYIANIVAMAMIASSFGEYCALLIFGEGYSEIWVNVLASLLVVGLTAVNFIGAETVSKAETIIVLFKLAVLAIFTVATLFLLDSSKLAPSTWPSFNLILASLALTFLAFAGFNVIGNTAEDMDNPQRDIPRAMYAAIGITMVLYVAIALAVFGTLSLQEIQDNAETVLAVAAQPIFGQVGFVIMTLGALAATASAVNATLYGSANITYALAKEGELPRQFKHRMWGSNEGLLITAAAVLILTTLFPLNVIASIASATFLLIYLLVNAAHLRLREQTGGNRFVIILALAACLFALALWAIHTFNSQPQSLLVVLVFIIISFAAEAVIQRTRKRRIRPRFK
ncbi:MAG: APC family permease, partial [Candidatus Promineifilaceae bacterium]|nr:APC family permease [Candidatus Promineifilaceae bacterium]